MFVLAMGHQIAAIRCPVRTGILQALIYVPSGRVACLNHQWTPLPNERLGPIYMPRVDKC
jgi:hypothetical protein